MVLRNEASLARFEQRFDEAERLAKEAEALYVRAADQLERAGCLCESGHIALASGQDASGILEQVHAVARTVQVGPGGALEKLIDKLQRAQAAFEAGRPLLRGECVEDIPPGLRRWLVESDE